MADLDGDDMCRCGAICTCGGEEWGEEYDQHFDGCSAMFGTCDCERYDDD